MRLSQTPRGRGWLSNFEAREQITARLLLDSVHLVPMQRVLDLLQDLILKDVEGKPEHSPLLAIPEMSGAALRSLGVPDASSATAFDDFVPGRALPGQAGSEAVVANLCRDIARLERALGTARVRVDMDLKELQAAKIRTIAIVADHAGTGSQVEAFARTITRNATIRSWRSGSFVRIRAVVAYCTPEAEARLRRCAALDDVAVGRSVETFSSIGWTQSEREAVEALCRRYTPRAKKREALGFAGSGGLFSSTRAVPNNLPYILRRPAEAGWRALLAGRTVPKDLASLELDAPSASEREKMRSIGQPRLALSIERFDRREHATAIIVMAALARRRHSISDLSRLSHLQSVEVESLVTWLVEQGLATKSMRLSESGHELLRAARRKSAGSSVRPSVVSDSYYPQALR